jgi:hypothetical protein
VKELRRENETLRVQNGTLEKRLTRLEDLAPRNGEAHRGSTEE